MYASCIYKYMHISVLVMCSSPQRSLLYFIREVERFVEPHIHFQAARDNYIVNADLTLKIYLV